MRRGSLQRHAGAPNRFNTRDLLELCRQFYQHVVSHMDSTIFFLGLYDVASQTVEVVWQSENGKELSGGSLPLGKGLIGQVIRSGHSRVSARIASTGRHARFALG